MYQSIIKECLAGTKYANQDPKNVEKMMRIEHGVLDGLTKARFKKAALVAAATLEFDPTLIDIL
jgi:hypothetical protein